MILYKIK